MTIERATLAGGCFWGVEELIRDLPGVVETSVGYCGGELPRPTYGDICSGTTGHAEAIDIHFDSTKITYQEILHFFFKIHDPTTLNQQGNDKGSQYRSAIFVHHSLQEKEALKVIEQVNKLKRFTKPIVTTIENFKEFWTAEEEHQDYLQKYPQGYNCHYIRN